MELVRGVLDDFLVELGGFWVVRQAGEGCSFYLLT